MFTGLHEIDWSSLSHAYGSAEDVPGMLHRLCSTDIHDRRAALDEFYGAVHHQGDVYASTTASLPFLFELAVRHDSPGRSDVVDLLVSIGEVAVARCNEFYGEDAGDGFRLDFARAAVVLRQRADTFEALVSDPDPRVRLAAIPALGLLLNDAQRAAALLRNRLSAEHNTMARVAVVETMATLAIRMPSYADPATSWLAALSDDPGAAPEVRLAALAHQARCRPELTTAGDVAKAIKLIRQTPQAAVPIHQDAPRVPSPQSDVPPQVLAAFEDLDRMNRVHALTTRTLSTLHGALAGRVAERTTLLAEQLSSGDPGARLDAVRMSDDLMKHWRGDHSTLVTLVAQQLDPREHDVSAQAAAVLEACHALAEPARQQLADYVLAQQAAYGPQVWADAPPQPRRAHQLAVQALARLGDTRALPSLLTALDTGVDAWRAVNVAAALPQAADALVPRLCRRLQDADPASSWPDMRIQPVLSALRKFRHAAALPVLEEMLDTAITHRQGQIICSTLAALAAYGPGASEKLSSVRTLTSSDEPHIRPAAIAALWSLSRDKDEVLPHLLEMLNDTAPFPIMEAADVLGQIGSAADVAVPRLRDLISHGYDWVRVHCAAALWDIGGEAEAAVVLPTLLGAWQENRATASYVVARLDRMGISAQPAVPHLRSQLEIPDRNPFSTNIENDENVQRICRELIRRLS